MENQTRFDLSAAIENWRQELAAEPNLTPVVRNELETHLRETIADFQKRGLNNGESFWLARRRVGPSQPLGQEFLKANPAAVWRERIMWMAIAVLLTFLWAQTVNVASRAVLFTLWSSNSPASAPRLFHSLLVQAICEVPLRTVPLIVLAGILMRGQARFFSRLARIFERRSRFVVLGLGWLALNEVCQLRFVTNLSAWADSLLLSLWPLTLIGFIAFLMGPAKDGTSKNQDIRRPWVWPFAVCFLAECVAGAALWFGGVVVFAGHFPAGLLLRMFFGLQMPIVLLALWKAGLVSPDRFERLRPLALVWNLTLGAILTTPEIVPQLMMAAALQVIYELSLWVVSRWEQTRNAQLE
jgi:hypothetical protein